MNKSELIKDLRSLTQAGMKDCKDSLEEAGWDLDKAVDIVKAKGLNIVSGRDGKVAAEGRVVASPLTGGFSMVEVNCQTDFVGNGVVFGEFANHVAKVLADKTEVNEAFDVSDVEEERKKVVAATKENVVVRRWWVEQTLSPLAKTFSYIHSNNKLGVLLTLVVSSSEGKNSSELISLGNDLAMQVAAMNPLVVSSDSLDASTRSKQETIFLAQIKEMGKAKSEEQTAKILDGKFKKWYTEVCLVEQESVVHSKKSVKSVIEELGTTLGCKIDVVSFYRCQVGEGIESKSSDFAAEVAQMAGVAK